MVMADDMASGSVSRIVYDDTLAATSPIGIDMRAVMRLMPRKKPSLLSMSRDPENAMPAGICWSPSAPPAIMPTIAWAMPITMKGDM